MTELKGKLYVHVLLDCSGSMTPNKGITIRAYNEYINTLPDDAVISLSMFATGALRHPKVNVTKARAKMTVEEYEIFGGTALYDAIGTTINMIDSAAKEYDRIAFVVQTDGQEIDSREISLAQVKQMITDKQDGEGWLIVFLGATLEAFEQFRSMGAAVGNAMQYGVANTRATMQSVGRATQAYTVSSNRAEGRQSANFTDDERNRSR